MSKLSLRLVQDNPKLKYREIKHGVIINRHSTVLKQGSSNFLSVKYLEDIKILILVVNLVLKKVVNQVLPVKKRNLLYK